MYAYDVCVCRYSAGTPLPMCVCVCVGGFKEIIKIGSILCPPPVPAEPPYYLRELLGI